MRVTSSLALSLSLLSNPNKAASLSKAAEPSISGDLPEHPLGKSELSRILSRDAEDNKTSPDHLPSSSSGQLTSRTNSDSDAETETGSSPDDNIVTWSSLFQRPSKASTENKDPNRISTASWSKPQITSFQKLFRNFSTDISVLKSVDQRLIRPLELIDLAANLQDPTNSHSETEAESGNHQAEAADARMRFSPGDHYDEVQDESRRTTALHHQTVNTSVNLQSDKCAGRPGTFYLSATDECRPLLDCQTIYDNVVVAPKIIANGIGKQIRVGRYLYNKKGNSTAITDSSTSSAESEARGTNKPPTPIPTSQLEGAVKVAFVTTKQNVKGKLARKDVTDRVSAGLNNLLAFQGNKNILRVYGACSEQITVPAKGNNPERSVDRTLIVSDFCQKGDLSNFLQSQEYQGFNIVKRVQLALSLLNTFKFLHNSPSGTRINCDMNAIHRALTQFLVTDDHEVVLNDLDDIPVSDESKSARCEWGIEGLVAKNELSTDDENRFREYFMAPEQVMSDDIFYSMYPEESKRFDTEKVDIWKLPDMVMYLLTKGINDSQASVEATQVLLTMEETLTRCKSIDYRQRPKVEEIIAKMESVLATLKLGLESRRENVAEVGSENGAEKANSYNEFLETHLVKRESTGADSGLDLEQ